MASTATPGWYPHAIRKPLTARSFRSMPNPVRCQLHTAVTDRASLHGQFNDGGVASHFFVRRDGTVEQYIPTTLRAACDLDGNPDTISIESWDGYPNGWRNGSDVPPWTAAQVTAIVGLLRWIFDAHPTIVLRQATSNKKGFESYGVSYHRLGVPGYARYGRPAGLLYSSSRGKVCPGDRRIAQVPGIIAAATHTTPAAPATPQPQEDDMPYSPAELATIVQDAARAAVLGVLQEPRYTEYVDENGNAQRDVRPLSDIFFSTHAHAVGANRTASVLAAKSGMDPAEVARLVVESLGAQVAESVEEVLGKLDLPDSLGYSLKEIGEAVVDELTETMTAGRNTQ